MGSNYYAEAFSPQGGHCFRMVTSAIPGQQGAPHHCSGPVKMGRVFTDGNGIRHVAEACMEHAGELSNWYRLDYA
jgi:hypothetical protein